MRNLITVAAFAIALSGCAALPAVVVGSALAPIVQPVVAGVVQGSAKLIAGAAQSATAAVQKVGATVQNSTPKAK
jgi:hypothetical protein